jgi:mannose-1-phosphate guanylyltransferase/mannose-6-phosphate isomerase
MKKNKVQSKYTVDSCETIETAWGKIEVNRARSVIVVQGDRVVGTLSDGDIRKAILNKRLLSTPVSEIMNLKFTFLTRDEENKVAVLFNKKDIFLIPIVNEQMKLVNIKIRPNTAD